MSPFGILLGLIVAVTASLSYLASRLYVLRFHTAPFRLLVHGHLLLGAISAGSLLLLWPGEGFDWAGYLPILLAMAGFYLVAQGLLFAVLRTVDASGVAALLSLKIVIVAVISVALLDIDITPMQWGGVLLAVGGAMVLNSGVGRLPWKAMLVVVMICTMYGLSDLSIKRGVAFLQDHGSEEFRAVLQNVALCYTFCGLAALVVLPWARADFRKNLVYAAPWAAAWGSCMIALFWAFAVLGVIPAQILQSFRGLISVLLGVLVSHLGHVHLETKQPGHVVVRRVAAAVFMVAAVALYARGKPADPPTPTSSPADTQQLDRQVGVQRAPGRNAGDLQQHDLQHAEHTRPAARTADHRVLAPTDTGMEM